LCRLWYFAATVTRSSATYTSGVPAWPAIPRRGTRRFWSRLSLFAAALLLANGLVGERGLLESVRARRAFAAAGQDLARLRHDNQVLRDHARRLRSDPDTIEAVARGELGLVRRDEILVTVRDLRRTSR